MTVNRGLGRGLSALFSDTDAEYENSSHKQPDTVSAEGTAFIPLNKIYPNPSQPRKTFDSEALNELARSIKQHGVLQPIILARKPDGYMIVAGERRFKAAQIAGIESIPAVVKKYTEEQISEIALIENLQREDLNPVEAALALRQLMENHTLTQDDIAHKIGKSRSAIANLLRLLALPDEILDMVRRNEISEGHARCLIGLDPEEALKLARSAAHSGLSVRETERAAKFGRGRIKSSSLGYLTQIKPDRELKQLVEDMQRVFGTKVSAVGSENKGRIYIDYFSSDDINRIFDVIEKLKKI
jgi:ParB family chromosome partitioning protein